MGVDTMKTNIARTLALNSRHRRVNAPFARVFLSIVALILVSGPARGL